MARASAEDLETALRQTGLVGRFDGGVRWRTLANSADRYPRLPTPADEILTLPEVAELLKVAEKTVYTMAQKAALPAFKVGGQWRFRRADLNRWIDDRTRPVKGVSKTGSRK